MIDRNMVAPNKFDGPNFPVSSRQGSLHNLTLDDVQSQLASIGKPLSTMNLDELVKNLISVEEGQAIQNPSSSSSSSSSPLMFHGNLNLDLNGTLGKKTVDEVWKQIVGQEHVNPADNQSVQQQQQSTLGETTLEEFLVRAGVISVGNQEGIVNPQALMAIDQMVLAKRQSDWLQFQMATNQQQMSVPMQAVVDSNFQVSDMGFENPVVDVGYPENHVGLPMPGQAVAATSSDSQVGDERKGGVMAEMMEKTIERRQRRMIKNRESAARSRARKQVMSGA